METFEVHAEHRTYEDAQGVTIHYTVWHAQGPRGVIQISHGVGEHARRYDELARVLATRGFTGEPPAASFSCPDTVRAGVPIEFRNTSAAPGSGARPAPTSALRGRLAWTVSAVTALARVPARHVTWRAQRASAPR